MYFVPGTPVYEANRGRLLRDGDWGRCTGRAVHYPRRMSPEQLQREVLRASARIYSLPRLLHALRRRRGMYRLLFAGECLWQWSVRADLKRELPWLRALSASPRAESQ